MLFYILLTIQIIVSVSMAGLILIQRSEGGALGMGGGGGFMSARGTGNLLTRATAILGFVFFANSIGLTIVGNYSQRVTSAVDKVDTSGLTVDTSAQPAAPSAAPAPTPKVPTN
jgi:preprotein translocase subunit SecG